jgi:hypothetical protein
MAANDDNWITITLRPNWPFVDQKHDSSKHTFFRCQAYVGIEASSKTEQDSNLEIADLIKSNQKTNPQQWQAIPAHRGVIASQTIPYQELIWQTCTTRWRKLPVIGTITGSMPWLYLIVAYISMDREVIAWSSVVIAGICFRLGSEMDSNHRLKEQTRITGSIGRHDPQSRQYKSSSNDRMADSKPTNTHRANVTMSIKLAEPNRRLQYLSALDRRAVIDRTVGTGRRSRSINFSVESLDGGVIAVSYEWRNDYCKYTSHSEPDWRNSADHFLIPVGPNGGSSEAKGPNRGVKEHLVDRFDTTLDNSSEQALQLLTSDQRKQLLRSNRGLWPNTHGDLTF